MNILPAIVFSAASFFLCQVLFLNCRFRAKPLICPLNWFLCLYCLQLVLVPVVVALVGPSSEFLPFMPSNTAINVALLLNTVAYGSFCVAVQVFHKKQSVALIESSGISAHSWFPPIWLIVLYAIFGIIGLQLRFGSLENLTDYVIDPQLYLFARAAQSGGPTTLGEAAGTFLTVFFPFSMILLWCRGAYQEGHKKGIASPALSVILLAMALLSASLSSYSRVGLVVLMIAVAAVMTKRSASGNKLPLLALGTFVAILLLIISTYRLAFTYGGGVITKEYDLTDMSDMFQDYGTAPQYLGFLLQGTDYAENPSLGRVLLSSALSPVPIVGKSFREHSGNAIYNTLLGRSDQPDTFVGELFLDFSIFGVIGGFFAVGAIVAALQNRFEVSNEPYQVFVLQYVSVCISYFVVMGIEEVSQHAIFLFPPIYAFVLYLWMKKRQVTRFNNSKNLGSLKLFKTV